MSWTVYVARTQSQRSAGVKAFTLTCTNNWSKEFLEAGKKRLQGDTVREANSSEVTGIKAENSQLKELVAELSLKNRVLKISLNALDAELDD